jgi:hypothetical protein
MAEGETGQTWCRVTVLQPNGSTLGRWTLRGEGAPDLTAVEWVARLQLAAQSAGGQAVLEDVAAPFAELLELAGLGNVLRRG